MTEVKCCRCNKIIGLDERHHITSQGDVCDDCFLSMNMSPMEYNWKIKRFEYARNHLDDLEHAIHQLSYDMKEINTSESKILESILDSFKGCFKGWEELIDDMEQSFSDDNFDKSWEKD